VVFFQPATPAETVRQVACVVEFTQYVLLRPPIGELQDGAGTYTAKDFWGKKEIKTKRNAMENSKEKIFFIK